MNGRAACRSCACAVRACNSSSGAPSGARAPQMTQWTVAHARARRAEGEGEAAAAALHGQTVFGVAHEHHGSNPLEVPPHRREKRPPARTGGIRAGGRNRDRSCGRREFGREGRGRRHSGAAKRCTPRGVAAAPAGVTPGHSFGTWSLITKTSLSSRRGASGFLRTGGRSRFLEDGISPTRGSSAVTVVTAHELVSEW